MLSRLHRQFDRMERRRRALLAHLDGLTDAQRAFRPSPEAWSIVDVLDHVTRSEHLSSRFLARWAERADASERLGLAPRVRSAVLNAVMRSPLRVKVPPNARGVTPDGTASFSEVLARWDESRARLRDVLESVPADALGRAAYRHPVAGRLTLMQALRFLDTHLIHHERQIRRIRRAPGFPTASG